MLTSTLAIAILSTAAAEQPGVSLTIYSSADPRGFDPQQFVAQQRGLAASCQTFLQSTANGLTAALLAPALWASVQHLALGMAGALCAWPMAWAQNYPAKTVRIINK